VNEDYYLVIIRIVPNKNDLDGAVSAPLLAGNRKKTRHPNSNIIRSDLSATENGASAHKRRHGLLGEVFMIVA